MPVGEYMFSSLKSNKSIVLDKSKRFRKTLGGNGKLDKNEFDFPEGTTEVLQNIRERLQKERKQLLWKRGVLFSIVMFTIIILLIY